MNRPYEHLGVTYPIEPPKRNRRKIPKSVHKKLMSTSLIYSKHQHAGYIGWIRRNRA